MVFMGLPWPILLMEISVRRQIARWNCCQVTHSLNRRKLLFQVRLCGILTMANGLVGCPIKPEKLGAWPERFGRCFMEEMRKREESFGLTLRSAHPIWVESSVSNSGKAEVMHGESYANGREADIAQYFTMPL